MVEKGKCYLQCTQAPDFKFRAKSFCYTLGDKVVSICSRKATQICSAVFCPVAGTLLFVCAAGKTVLLPISASAGWKQDHMSVRAVGHDYVLAARFLMKGLKSTAKLLFSHHKLTNNRCRQPRELQEKLLEPLTAVLKQETHTPGMRMVSPMKMLKAGAKELFYRKEDK